MSYRSFVSQGLLAVIAAVAVLAPAHVAGQTSSPAKATTAAKTTTGGGAAKAFTPPKTPWGDPNLQGVGRVPI